MGNCPYCSTGILDESLIEHPVHRNGKVILFTGVPVIACNNQSCDEYLFKPVTVEIMHQFFEEFFKADAKVNACVFSYDFALEWYNHNHKSIM